MSKSIVVGAEIGVNENEITIAWSPPSILGGILSTLGATELATFSWPFLGKKDLSAHAGYRVLEQEIGSFLRQKFELPRAVAR